MNFHFMRAAEGLTLGRWITKHKYRVSDFSPARIPRCS